MGECSWKLSSHLISNALEGTISRLSNAGGGVVFLGLIGSKMQPDAVATAPGRVKEIVAA